MGQPPGTVSRILWHFTGGPAWNTAENRQGSKRKPSEEAYKALLSILKSKELRLGAYREVVKVHVPKLRRYNKAKGKTEVLRNTIVEIASSQVCCLSDIPAAHLSYHAKRYGKIAIGFHRDAAVRHGFNPVFYTLHKAHVLRSLRGVFRELRRDWDDSIRSIADHITASVSDLSELECDSSGVERDLEDCVDDLTEEAQGIEDGICDAKEGFSEFLAFVKTFDEHEFSNIYCEREWRSIKPFSFTMDDLAMIVLPKSGGKGASYFSEFVKGRHALKLPQTLPVVPWEDLIEH